MSNRGFFAQLLVDVASVFRVYRGAAVTIVGVSLLLGMIVTAIV